MEEQLDLVAEGEVEWQKILRDFYEPFDKLLEIKYDEVEKLVMDEESKEICDKCSKPMIIKFGRFGKFLACSGFPDCKNAKPIPGVSNGNEPKKIDMKCPKCEDGDVVERFARKTKKKFWGCSKYPDCDWASWEDPLNPKEPKKANAEEK